MDALLSGRYFYCPKGVVIMSEEKDIGSLSVKIGLDGSSFQAGVGAINKQLAVVKSEFALAASKIGEFGTGTDALKVKADSLTKQIELQKQKVEALNNAFDKSVESKGKDAKATQDLEIKLNKAKTEMSGMENSLSKTTAELKTQSSVLGRLGDEYDKAFKQAKQSMGTAFDQMKVVGAGITAAGAGIAAGLGLAVKKTMDFDAEMSKVKALSGSTGEQFDKLRQQAIDLGAKTSFSASQSAEGMQKLAAAGFNASQIMAAMPGVLDATAASGADMTLVAETMGAALNTFGLDASQAGHVADVLATAANASAIDVQDMAFSLKYAGPVAKSLGVTLEETTNPSVCNAQFNRSANSSGERNGQTRIIY
jgi:phage-related minor tail protein